MTPYRIEVPSIALLLVCLVLGELELFSSITALNFFNYTISISYFTYLFVTKLYKLSKAMHKSTMGTKQKQQKDGMIIKIVQYTVLVSICAVSTLIFMAIQMIGFLFDENATIQFIFIIIASFMLGCDMMINYISLIFQFHVYRHWYKKLFHWFDKRARMLLNIYELKQISINTFDNAGNNSSNILSTNHDTNTNNTTTNVGSSNAIETDRDMDPDTTKGNVHLSLKKIVKDDNLQRQDSNDHAIRRIGSASPSITPVEMTVSSYKE